MRTREIERGIGQLRKAHWLIWHLHEFLNQSKELTREQKRCMHVISNAIYKAEARLKRKSA